MRSRGGDESPRPDEEDALTLSEWVAVGSPIDRVPAGDVRGPDGSLRERSALRPLVGRLERELPTAGRALTGALADGLMLSGVTWPQMSVLHEVARLRVVEPGHVAELTGLALEGVSATDLDTTLAVLMQVTRNLAEFRQRGPGIPAPHLVFG